MLKSVGLLLAAFAAIGATAIALGRYAWSRDTAVYLQRLHATSLAVPRVARYSEEETAALPAPVQRYFRFALTPGQTLVRTARIFQMGEFATRPGSWSRFSAMEVFVARPPGFLWNANISMAPFLSTYVRDGFANGKGELIAKVAGLVTVADDRGNREIDSGELLRFLAEAPYLPTVLLPGSGVEWTPLDDRSARAVLTHGSLSVSLEFTFGANGAITTIAGERYYRAPSGGTTLERWVGHWTKYVRVDGMMVPAEGDVEWHLPTGPVPYWRGRTIRAEYE